MCHTRPGESQNYKGETFGSHVRFSSQSPIGSSRRCSALSTRGAVLSVNREVFMDETEVMSRDDRSAPE
jgi:hypothetical protein